MREAAFSEKKRPTQPQSAQRVLSEDRTLCLFRLIRSAPFIRHWLRSHRSLSRSPEKAAWVIYVVPFAWGHGASTVAPRRGESGYCTQTIPIFYVNGGAKVSKGRSPTSWVLYALWSPPQRRNPCNKRPCLERQSPPSRASCIHDGRPKVAPTPAHITHNVFPAQCRGDL